MLTDPEEYRPGQIVLWRVGREINLMRVLIVKPRHLSGHLWDFDKREFASFMRRANIDHVSALAIEPEQFMEAARKIEGWRAARSRAIATAHEVFQARVIALAADLSGRP